jgi:hypothetical protein
MDGQATEHVGRSEGMQKWEFATVPLIEHATQEILNNWGDDGWDLVTVLQGPQGIVAYMKRPKA